MSATELKAHLHAAKCASFYFIGISGVGMRAVAKLLLTLGYEVHGSDLAPCDEVKEWADAGLIKLNTTHDEANIRQADCVIYSSAIKAVNPEYQAAIRIGKLLYHRSEMLALIASHFRLVAISGTHGKTTTSAMLVHILRKNNRQPSYCVGASYNGQIIAELDTGDLFVLEADESDGSFLSYAPDVSVVTNINYDHMENYQGSAQKYEDSFARFVEQAKLFAVITHGSKGVDKLPLSAKEKAIIIGHDLTQDGIVAFNTIDHGVEAKVRINGELYHLSLPVAGKHMLENALLAVKTAIQLGLEPLAVIQSLASFRPTDRRFEICQLPHAIIVSDYGHHPHEIRATISTARELWPDRELRMIFQAHRYSRLRYHFSEFIDVLSHVDQLILVPVFSAGEVEDDAYNIQSLMDQVQCDKVSYLSNIDKISGYIRHQLPTDSVMILQGAGSIGSILKEVVKTS